MLLINSHGVNAKTSALYKVLHTLVIGAKLFKELGDRVKSRKNPCPNSQIITIAPMNGRTHTNPCDNGRWGRC
jgi:hypothetical protein